ncbi:hypothetical protein [Rufibacter sp. XAAS-G3-1]|uniref:hypothetical protein n=1 Tax=Rufibacter sp. XAAS-G3-1 TaxID=2729134 RepID=UPI0015E7828C|nr:hypothetical protein [Rufibacter sp. XAAS-G3-1]
MTIIETSSEEYRELAVNAIVNQDVHVLSQLREANEAGAGEVVVLGSFLDALIYSTDDDDNDDERAEVITDLTLYNFFHNPPAA